MAEAEGGRNKWLIPVIVVVVIIVIAIIIIIILITLAEEDIGKKCTSNSDCRIGLVCATDGTCKLSDDDPCETSDQCASGFCTDGFCTSGTGTNTSCSATGAPPCASGEVCDATSGRCVSNLGGFCLLNNDCVQPAICTAPIVNGATGIQGICLGTTGAACSADSQCLSGTCNIPSGGSTGTCIAPTAADIANARNGGLMASMNTASMATPLATRLVPSPALVSTPAVRVGMDCMSTTPINQTFCVESGLSRTERVINFHTPSPREVEAPFRETRKNIVTSRVDTKQSPVIDVTNYSDSTLALTQDGRIIRETDHRGGMEMVANNVRLKRLEAFNGTLYGVSVDGRVFALNNDTFRTRKWHWNLTPFPSGVTHTSATLNGKHFWVQTNDRGILYDRDLNIVERQDTRNRKRVYGDNRDLYIEINTRDHAAVLQPNGTEISNVAGAVITHDDKVKILKPNEMNKYSDIRLVNWQPAYIRRVL